jgi:hypothetical protein
MIKLRFVRWMDKERMILMEAPATVGSSGTDPDTPAHIEFFKNTGAEVVGKSGARTLITGKRGNRPRANRLQCWQVDPTPIANDAATSIRAKATLQAKRCTSFVLNINQPKQGNSNQPRTDNVSLLRPSSPAPTKTDSSPRRPVNAPASNHETAEWTRILPYLIEGDRELGIPRQQRQQEAEDVISGWFNDWNNAITRRQGPMVLATDGSMFPATATQGERRTVSAACVSEQFQTGARVIGNASVVMHGEILGIIMALVQARQTGEKSLTIHSDYLNAKKMLLRFTDSQTDSIANNSAGLSWFKWMFSLYTDSTNDGAEIRLEHIKAHTGNAELSIEQQLNEKADKVARDARLEESKSMNIAPWPTFKMEEFTAWSPSEGYVERDIYGWVKTARIQTRGSQLRFSNPLAFDKTCLDRTPPDKWAYTKSIRDYSLRVQVQARGRALMTNLKQHRMFPGQQNPYCHHCPSEIENEYHIFVTCPAYNEIRMPRINHMIEHITAKLEKVASNPILRHHVEVMVRRIFSDGEWWPGYRSRYYLGVAPVIQNLEPTPYILTKLQRQLLGKLIHGETFRLTGYIWSVRMQRQFCTIMEVVTPDNMESKEVVEPK